MDGEVDRVEIVYNRYVSALTQEVTRETLLPLQQATIMGDDGAVDSLGERAAVKEDGKLDQDHDHTRWWSTSPTPRSSSSV